jgi:hypothetical protein
LISPNKDGVNDMKSKIIIFFCLVSLSANVTAGAAGGLTLVSHWVGPNGYDGVQVKEGTSVLGGGCANNKWFAIETSNPNYKCHALCEFSGAYGK